MSAINYFKCVQGRGVIRRHICLFFGVKIKFVLSAKKIYSVNVHECRHIKVQYLFPDVPYLFYPKIWKISIKIMCTITVFIKDATRIFTRANLSWSFTINYNLAVSKIYINGIIKCSVIH